MSNNVTWHDHHVSKQMRANIKHQTPCILWFTGLSGSGKSTIANMVEMQLHTMNKHTYLLDGDNIRHGLNQDLGFNEFDRVENIRRIGEVSKLFVDSGLIVLTAFISPFQKERDAVRNKVAPHEFIEVFIDTPIEICEQRDPKGLYKKARKGEIESFTGIDSPYEMPKHPEIHIKNDQLPIDQAASQVIDYLNLHKYI